MNPPETCPRCGVERSGIADGRATYKCGTIFIHERTEWILAAALGCCPVSSIEKLLFTHNPIAEEMTRRVDAQIIPTHVDILHEVKRDAWKRGAETMRASVMELVEGRGDVLVDTEVRIAALEIPPYADA